MRENRKKCYFYAANIGAYGFMDPNCEPNNWKIYEDTPEGREQALLDGDNSFSVFTFNHPLEKGKSQPMRYGDLVLDFNALKDVWDYGTERYKKVGDIATALKAVRKFVDNFCFYYDVNPEHLRYYASGGKGFHVIIPAQLMGAENGSVFLNEIYNSMLSKILTTNINEPVVFEALKIRTLNQIVEENYANCSGFKGGKGPLLRLPHMQRHDGNYKVPVTYKEIMFQDASFFEDIVKHDRNIPEEDNWPELEKNLEVVPKLEHFFLEMKQARLRYFGNKFWPSPEGLLYYPDPSDREDYKRISSCLEVLADGRTLESRGWSKYVKLTDPDGNEHLLLIPYTDLSGTGEKALTALSNLGLELSSEKNSKSLLLEYLRTTQSNRRATIVNKSGWFNLPRRNRQKKNDLFFVPHDLGRTSTGDYLLLDPKIRSTHLEIKGTLEQWQENIGQPCGGNPILQQVIMQGIAPLFLETMKQDGFGLHLYGDSSTGKSTGLRVNSSVSGVSLTTWRKTDNAFEGHAAQHNHLCMILDEMGQGTANAVSDAIYMLAHGEGKERMDGTGKIRDSYTWRGLFLSSGELTSAEKIKENQRKKAMAGQEVRLACLLADGGTGNKIFTKVPSGLTAAEFADTLSRNSAKYRGTALIACIESIKSKNGTDAVKNFMDREIETFLASLDGAKLNTQSRRVAKHFAFIAAAGEYAISEHIFPWEKGAGQYAAKYCFELWLRLHGGTVELEIQALAKKIITLVENKFNGKFSNLYSSDKEADPVHYYEKHKQRCCFIARKYLIDNGICRDDQYRELLKYFKSKNLLVLQNGQVQEQKYFSGQRPPRGFSIIIDNIYVELGEIDDNEIDSQHNEFNKSAKIIHF